MPASLTTIADSLTACKRDFSVQLLENTNATLSELASLDGCSTDVKAVSQCISAQTGAAASGATAVPRAAASGSGDMAGEVLAEACAAAVSGSSNAADCPSPAAAQVMAGVPLLSGGGMVFAPVSDASVLRISASNTRGTTTWRAFCYCDDTWDPVCDGNTRKQYPNACSARCQVRFKARQGTCVGSTQGVQVAQQAPGSSLFASFRHPADTSRLNSPSCCC